MNDLSRESRALLAAARHRDGLSAADKDRVRNKLAHRIGAGLALGSAVTASATVAEAAHSTVLATVATWLPGAAKLLGVVALAGGATVGVVHVSHLTSHRGASTANVSRDPAVAKRGNSSLSAAHEPAQTWLTVPDNSPEASNLQPKEPPAPAVELSTATKRERRNISGVATAFDPRSAALATPVDDGLASQVAAIREARAAIRRGDGRAALAAIDRGLPQGQTGPLEQEATLARVSALCLLGDIAAARQTAEQFLTRFPESLLASRIRSSCAFAPATSP